MMQPTEIGARMSAAVDDTPVPPGLAVAALAGGRARRRRRAVGVAVVAVAAVVGGALLLPRGHLAACDGQVADRGVGVTATAEALAWARSLPAGADAALPFFGRGGLWSQGTRYDVPVSVDRTVAPRAVAGGWLVVVGSSDGAQALAVLAADGSLREVPGGGAGLEAGGGAGVAVSQDGRRVAVGDRVVDLVTMSGTRVPHAPASDSQDGYVTDVRMIGFTSEGLVYEAAPYARGLGTTYLLAADGTATPLDLPAGSHVPEGPADVAVTYDYAADDSDTCVTSYGLRGAAWERAGQGCLGRYLGEALSVSPGGQWLLTDDLPQVWDLRRGRFDAVDMPADVARRQMAAQMGGAVWESDDTFLLPVSDRWDNSVPLGRSYDHVVQVVRCSLPTGACERAGDEQEVRVTTSDWGTTELRFARP